MQTGNRVLRWSHAVVVCLLAATAVSAQGRFGPRDVDALPSSAPALVARYGTHALAFGELRIPSGTGPFPVAVVIHGGCWTVGFATLKNTAPLASALTEAGVATWNIEYRQVGDPGAGWPGTFLDVGAGVDYLGTLAEKYPIDLARVAVVGHSAGAHLALWSAGRSVLPKESPVRGADPLPVAAAVAIDGPGDVGGLVGRDAQICGKPVIAPLMGGTPAEQPARYHEGSPQEMLPLRVPQFLVAAAVLTLEDAQRYQARGRSAGDSVTVLPITNGNHFDVIGPGRAPFPAVLSLIRQAIGLDK